MGQKVNPLSLRLEYTNRRFDSCWYGDYQYSYLLSQDLKVKSYINTILKKLGCPESHISVIYIAKKIKILFCYLDPRRSAYKKSRRLYIKMVNKDPIEMNYKKRKYFKNRFLGRYLRKKLKKIGSSASKQAGIKHNHRLPFVIEKKEVVPFSLKKNGGHLIDINLANHFMGGDVQIYNRERNTSLDYNVVKESKELDLLKKRSPRDAEKTSQTISRHKKNKRKLDRFFSTPLSASLKVINKNFNKEKGENSKTFLTDATRAQRAQRVGSVRKEKGKRSLENVSKSKKKKKQLNKVNTTSQSIPYSPLVERKNPLSLLYARYNKEKKKKKKKYFTKRPLFDPSAKAYKNWWKAWRRRRRLKGKRITNFKFRRMEARYWKRLTNFSVLKISKKKNKKYDATFSIWSYLFYNHKDFFNKTIQEKKGFQTWQKSLFIRYLLLFVYKRRLKFAASPIKHHAKGQSCRLVMQANKNIRFVPFLNKKASKSYVKANLEKENKKTKNLYIDNSLISLNGHGVKEKDFEATADLTIAKQRRGLAKEIKNYGLLKYHTALESINKIEWFQGRSMSFLWLLFNSVHPSQTVKPSQKVKVIGDKSSPFNGSGKPFLLQNKYSTNSLFAASKKKKNTPILYTSPDQIQPNNTAVVKKKKSSIRQSGTENKTFSVSRLVEKVNFYNLSALQFGQEKVIVNKIENSSLCLPKKEGTFLLKQRKKKSVNNRFSVYKKKARRAVFKKNETGKYIRKKPRNRSLKMPRKSFYPRTAKSKGFLSYIEYILSIELKSNVRVFSCKTKNEKKSALFIVEQIIYFLQKRVPFSKIKQQLWRESRFKYMKGLRITYSGRLGGRSKKAQRSRQKTFQWGKTSSHVFSSKLSFASKSALTKFGKVGIKVWLCYK